MIIIAENYVKPEKLDEVRGVYQEVIAYTRKQPGCISYNLYEDLENPGSFTFVEEWNTEEDLNVHLEDQEFIELFSDIEKHFVMDEVLRKYEVLK